MAIPKALTVAGSDSGGGAGIQADLRTFAALGVYGMSAVTALTAQNTVAVRGIFEIPPEFVAAQIRAVMEDIGADAVKTGMLVGAPVISRVAREFHELGIEKLVVDPVMIAKSGDALLRREAVETLVRDLFPLATVVTPNLHEASALIGREVEDVEGMREAARIIHGFGPRYVVVKGGHLAGTPLDLLFDGERFIELADERYDTPHTHGTGCTFASAITAGLACGRTVTDAVRTAKQYISAAIREGLPIGHGHGPVHHMHDLYRKAGMIFR